MDNPIQGDPPVLDRLYNADREKYESRGITLDQFYVDMRDPVIQQKVYTSRDLQNKGINFRQFQHDLGVDPIVQPGSVSDLFSIAESSNNYAAVNLDKDNPKDKGAWGKYQFRWGIHGPKLKNFGIETTDDLLKAKYVQEEYMTSLVNNEYKPHVKTLRALANTNDTYKGYNDVELMYLEHHEGYEGAQILLSTGKSKWGSEKAIDKAITKMRNYQGKLYKSNAADAQIKDKQQKNEVTNDLKSIGATLENEALSKTNAKLNLEYNKLGFGEKVASAYKRGGIFKVLTDALPFTDADATPTELKAAKLDIVATTPKYKELVKSEDDLSKLLNNYSYKKDQEVEKLAGKISDDIKKDINTTSGMFDYLSGENYYTKDGKEYVNISVGKFGDIFVPGIDRSKTEVELSKLMTLKEHPAITPNMAVQDKQELNNALLRAQSDYAKADILRQDHYGTKSQDYLNYTNKVYRDKVEGLANEYGGADKIDPNDPRLEELKELESQFNSTLENFSKQPVKYKLASEYEATKQNIVANYDKDIKAMTGWQSFLHKGDRFLNEGIEYTNDSFLGLAKVAGVGVDAAFKSDIATTSLIEDAYAAATIRTTAETNAGLIETAYLGNDVYAKYQNGEVIGFVDSDFYDINLPEAENKRLMEVARNITPSSISTSFNWSAINEGVRTGIMDFAPLLIGGSGIVTVMKGTGAKVARNKTLSKVGQSMINLADNTYFTTLASTFGGFAGKVTKGAIQEGGLINADEIFIAGVSKTALEAAIESINPIEGKILSGKIFNTGAISVKAFAEMVAKKGFVPSIGDLAKITGRNLIEQGIGEGAEELIASLAEPLVLNNILNNTIDTNFSTDVNLRDVAEATLIGSLSGLTLGAGTNIRYAKNLKSNILQDAIRTSLQNEKFFNTTLDNLKNQQLEDIEKSNSETKTEEAQTVNDNYTHTKKVYDQAKNDAAFVFKKSVKGKEASEAFQRNVSNIAFEKSILDNIDAPTDIEADLINYLSTRLGQDLKDIQVYYANGFNGYATINSINKDLGSDARLTPKEYDDNIDKIFEAFKVSVAKAGKTKLSEEAKQRQVAVDMGIVISTIKNGKASESAQKEADAFKEETAKAKEKAEATKAKAKVDDAVRKGKNPTDSGVSEDMVDTVMESERKAVVGRIAEIKPNDINGKLSYNKENFQVLMDDHPTQAQYIASELARLEKELSESENANYRQQAADKSDVPLTTDTFSERYTDNPELEENDNKQVDDAYVEHIANVKEELGEDFNKEELVEALNDKPLLEKISNSEEFPDYAEVAAETIPGNNLVDISTPIETPEFIIDDSPVPTDEELTSKADKVADIESRRQEELNQLEKELNDLGIIIGENNLKDAAEKILDDIQSPFVKQVLKALLNLISKTGTKLIITKGDVSGMGVSYSHVTNTIQINLDTILDGFNRNSKLRASGGKDGFILQTFDAGKGKATPISYLASQLLHETIHAFTTRQINSFEKNSKNELTEEEYDIIQKIQDIFNYIKSNKILQAEYGISDIHELLAELFSNETFADKLKNISLPKELQYKTKSKNLFEGIIDLISDLITKALKGFSKQTINNKETAFQNISNLVNDLINAKYDAEIADLNNTTQSDVTAEDLAFLGSFPDEKLPTPEQKPTPVTELQAAVITTVVNTNPSLANSNVIVDGPMYIQYLNNVPNIRIKLSDGTYRILPFADVRDTKSVLAKYNTDYFTIVPITNDAFVIKTDSDGTVHTYDEQFIIDNISIGDTVYYEYDPKSKYNSNSFNTSKELTVAVYVKDGKIVSPETEGATTKYIGRISSGKNQITTKNNVLSHIQNTEVRKQIPVLVDNMTMFTNNQFGNKRDITIDELLKHKDDLKVIGVEFTDPTIIGNDLIRNARFLTPTTDTNTGIERIPTNIKVHPHYLGSLAIYVKGQLLKLDTKTLKSAPILFDQLKAQLDQFEKAKDLKEVISVVQILRGNGDRVVLKNVRDVKSTFKNEEAENPRGGIESIYYYPNRKGDDKYTMVKKPSDKDFMTKDQVLGILGDYRVHIDHNLIDNEQYLEDIVQHAVQTEVPVNEPLFNNPRLYLADNIGPAANAEKVVKLTDDQNSKPEAPVTAKPIFNKTKFKIGSKTNSPQLTKGGDWIRERFSEIGVDVSDELLENLLNATQLAPGEKVWGAFHRASVILASDANVKVERHEAFHVVFNLFLNDKQRDQIRAEVRSKFGKDLTDLQAEEKLSDLFEDYKDRLLFDNDWSKANPKIANFFNKIYNWLYKNFNILQSYLTDSVTIDKLFYQLENNIIGRDFLGNRKQSVQDLFKRNLNNILDEPKFSISNWTSAQTHRYATFVNKDLFTMYLSTFHQNTNLNEIVDDNNTVDSILAGYAKNFEAIVEAYIEGTPEADAAIIRDIQKQFETNADFQFIIKKNLKITQNVAIDAEYEDIVDEYSEGNEDVVSDDTEEESKRESWQGSASLIDSKSRASSKLRGLFSNYIYKKEVIEDGKKSLEAFTYEDTGQAKFYGANEIHNVLLEKLSNSTSRRAMVDKLNSLLDNYNWVVDLLRDIRGIDNETALELYNSGNLKLDYEHDNLDNVDKLKGGWILKSMWYAIGDQKNNDPVQLLYTRGGARLDNLRADNKGKSIRDSFLYNIDILSTDTTKLGTLSTSLTNIYNKIIQPAYKQDPQDYLDFIKLLGYEVDLDQARELSSINKSASVTGNKLTNKAFINGRFKAIVDSFKAYSLDKNATALQSNLTLDFTTLANHISDYTLNPGNLSFKNVIGELEFAHIPSNYITRQFDLIKEDPKKWVKGKISSVRGSVTYPVVLQARLPFYKDLLSSYQTYFGIAIDGFYNTENQSSGKQYKDYTEQDVLVSDINKYIAGPGPNKKGGVYNFGVFSDAPVRYLYYGNKFTKEEIVSRLTAIVHGEFERIQLVRQFNGESGYKNIDRTGLIIHSIPSVNKLLPFIPENWGGLNDSQVYDSKVSTKSVTDVVKDHIDRYLSEDAYGKYLDKLKDNNQITPESNIHAVTLTKNSKLLKDAKNLLFEYYINQFYVNTTMQIVFAGDPAFYKPNDVHNAGVNSYKDVLKSDFNPKNLLTGIDTVKRYKELVSPMIRGWFNKPTFKLLVLKDVEVKVNSEIPGIVRASDYEAKVQAVLLKEYGVQSKKVIDPETGVESTVDVITKNNANLSDAGAYHTLSRRVDILKAYDTWKDEYQGIIDRLERGKGSKRDLEFVMQPLKPFLFTNQQRLETTNNPEAPAAVMQVPIQLKLSETVLIPQVAYVTNNNRTEIPTRKDFNNDFAKYKYKDLAKSLYLMNLSGSDMLVFESGSKAASFNVLDLNNFSGSAVKSAAENLKSTLIGDNSVKDSDVEDIVFNDMMSTIINSNMLELNNDDYGDQMSVPEKTVDAKVGEGTQERKAMTAGIDSDYKFTFNGVTYKQYQVNELLDRISIDGVKENLTKVLDKIGKYSDFTNYLRNQLVDKNASVDVLDALAIQSDGFTRTPLELLGKKAEHTANSLFKKTAKNKKFGASLVNQPGVGFDDKLKLVFKTLPNGDKVVDYYEAAIPAYSKHLLKYADKDGVINPADLPEKLLRAFFYRIPTEDKYSMFPIKIKYFLPQSQGGTIILPAEATIIAGLDFDIDKLYGYFYNFTAEYDNEFITGLTKTLNAREGKSLTIDQVKDLVNTTTDKSMDELRETLENPEEIIGIINSEITKALVRPKLSIIENSFDSKEGRDNLRLDIYTSLVNTKAYTKAMLRIGSKQRLVNLRNELAKGTSNDYTSFADPTTQAENSAKNIIGKRLIGIFANANAFINLIQGNAELQLSNTILFGDKVYSSIGAISENITKNISELLFASTEDVKDPVLGPLNINESTANVLITMLALGMPFEESILFLNTPAMKYVSKTHQGEGGRLVNIYNDSPYTIDPNVLQILVTAEEFSRVISAAKIDTGNVGPDLSVVNNKVKSMNSAIKNSTRDESIFKNTGEIIPGITYDPKTEKYSVDSSNVKVKQLIAYADVLATELNVLKDYFSYLKGDFYNYTTKFEKITRNGKLRDDQLKLVTYATYDYFIQHTLLAKIPKFEKLVTALPNYFSKYEFGPETAPLKNILEVTINKNNNTKQILMKVDNFTSAQIEYYKGLFEILIKEDQDNTDPDHVNFGTNLAVYSLLLGTAFSYRGFSKLLPTMFWDTAIGKDIRSIINGTTTLNFEDPNLYSLIIYNNFTKLVPKIDNELLVINGPDITVNNSASKDNKGNFLPYIYYNSKVNNVSSNTLLAHVGNGVYNELLKTTGRSYIKDYLFTSSTPLNPKEGFNEFSEFSELNDDIKSIPPPPPDYSEFSRGEDNDFNDFIRDNPPTEEELNNEDKLPPC